MPFKRHWLFKTLWRVSNDTTAVMKVKCTVNLCMSTSARSPTPGGRRTRLQDGGPRTAMTRPHFNARYRRKLGKKTRQDELWDRLVFGDLEKQHARLREVADQRAMHAIQNIQRRSFVHFLHKTWPEFRWIMQPKHLVDALVCLKEVPELPSYFREDPSLQDLLVTFCGVLRYQKELMGIADIVESYSSICAHPAHSLPAIASSLRQKLIDCLAEKMLYLADTSTVSKNVEENAVERWISPLKNRDLLLLVGEIHDPLRHHMQQQLDGGNENGGKRAKNFAFFSVYKSVLHQLLKRRWHHRNDRAIVILATMLFRQQCPEDFLRNYEHFLSKLDICCSLLQQVGTSEDIRSLDPSILSILADVLTRCSLYDSGSNTTSLPSFQRLDQHALHFMHHLAEEIDRRYRIAQRRNLQLFCLHNPHCPGEHLSNDDWSLNDIINREGTPTQGAPARKPFDQAQSQRILQAFRKVRVHLDISPSFLNDHHLT